MALDTINTAISNLLTQCKDEIISRHIAAGQQASGNTARSLVVEQVEDCHWRLVQRGDSYAPLGTLDEGRQPGKVPTGFSSILLKWAEAKGIKFQSVSKANSWAYLTARKIAEFGTQRYTDNDDVVSIPIEKLKQQLPAEISILWKAEVEQRIYRNDIK